MSQGLWHKVEPHVVDRYCSSGLAVAVRHASHRSCCLTTHGNLWIHWRGDRHCDRRGEVKLGSGAPTPPRRISATPINVAAFLCLSAHVKMRRSFSQWLNWVVGATGTCLIGLLAYESTRPTRLHLGIRHAGVLLWDRFWGSPPHNHTENKAYPPTEAPGLLAPVECDYCIIRKRTLA